MCSRGAASITLKYRSPHAPTSRLLNLPVEASLDQRERICFWPVMTGQKQILFGLWGS